MINFKSKSRCLMGLWRPRVRPPSHDPKFLNIWRSPLSVLTLSDVKRMWMQLYVALTISFHKQTLLLSLHISAFDVEMDSTNCATNANSRSKKFLAAFSARHVVTCPIMVSRRKVGGKVGRETSNTSPQGKRGQLGNRY